MIPYLAALAVLVLNDHVLKAAFPGLITGKLSDFAGVLALALFLRAVMPRHIACIAAGVLFIWWKSPLSQPFIDALPWEASRVVDWTDLAALAMLPVAYRMHVERMRAGIAVLSVFAFAATSVPHEWVRIEPGDPLARIETGMELQPLVTKFKQCRLSPYVTEDRGTLVLQTTWKKRDVSIFGKLENGIYSVSSLNVYGRDPVDGAAVRAHVLQQLQTCLAK